MKNEGKEFEKMFKDSIPEYVYYQRIKDSAGAWNNGDNASVRFTPQNNYDAFMFYSPLFFALELKSTKGTSFSFTGNTPMIKQHQIKGLLDASRFDNVVAGFIFNVRNVNATYFMSIVHFDNYINNTTKKSINENDIIQNNGLLIDSKLVRVKYKYDIGKFIDYFLE